MNDAQIRKIIKALERIATALEEDRGPEEVPEEPKPTPSQDTEPRQWWRMNRE